MDYQEAWKEMKNWLDQGIDYMKERKEKTSGKEQERIKNKLEGLTVARQHMEIYQDQ